MKTTDKFLIGIIIGIVLLVGIAFAVAFLRPEPDYLPEDTPEAAAHNYLLALLRKDYDRAYDYLSPTIESYPPAVEAFKENVLDSSYYLRWDENNVSLEVVSAHVTGDQATVTVRETRFNQGGLFDSGQNTNTFEMHLQRTAPGSAWKIMDSDSYWARCWNYKYGCQ